MNDSGTTTPRACELCVSNAGGEKKAEGKAGSQECFRLKSENAYLRPFRPSQHTAVGPRRYMRRTAQQRPLPAILGVGA